jgi:hypothetical protein
LCINCTCNTEIYVVQQVDNVNDMLVCMCSGYTMEGTKKRGLSPAKKKEAMALAKAKALKAT